MISGTMAELSRLKGGKSKFAVNTLEGPKAHAIEEDTPLVILTESEYLALTEKQDANLAEIQRDAAAYKRVEAIIMDKIKETLGQDEPEPAPLLKTDTGDFSFGAEPE